VVANRVLIAQHPRSSCHWLHTTPLQHHHTHTMADNTHPPITDTDQQNAS